MNSIRARWLIGILVVLALGVSGVWFLPGGAGAQLARLGPQQAALWDGIHWLCAALAVLFPLAAVVEWKRRPSTKGQNCVG